MCSVLMAELCLQSSAPRKTLLRLSAELNGAATAIADDFASRVDPKKFDTREISKIIEAATRIAEETVWLKLRARSANDE